MWIIDKNGPVYPVYTFTSGVFISIRLLIFSEYKTKLSLIDPLKVKNPLPVANNVSLFS